MSRIPVHVSVHIFLRLCLYASMDSRYAYKCLEYYSQVDRLSTTYCVVNSRESMYTQIRIRRISLMAYGTRQFRYRLICAHYIGLVGIYSSTYLCIHIHQLGTRYLSAYVSHVIGKYSISVMYTYQVHVCTCTMYSGTFLRSIFFYSLLLLLFFASQPQNF